MKKKILKKVFLGSGVFAAVILAAGLYVVFGVIGVESKRTYDVSEAVNGNINTNVTVIDRSVKYQTMNGFGASSCWLSQDVGGWENREEILSYLYDSEKGIGLNIYRYNLGAGTKGDERMLIEGRKTECFLQPDGSYDFTADQNAQNALATANMLAGGRLRVTLFCNSAPVYMTENGAGYCSPVADYNQPKVSNLAEENYEAFADYCYKCAEYFMNKGYRVTSLSPVNEPQYDWRAWYNSEGTYSVNQEGCYYSETQTRDLLNVMVKKFENSELEEKGCKISMFESGSIEGEGSACAAYLDCILGRDSDYVFKNSRLRKYFTSVNMHSYWSSAETKAAAAEYFADNYSNYDIVCSEYCQMTEDTNTGVYDLINTSGGTNGLTAEYGVAMANVIMDDLTILNAVEWNWWLGYSYGVYTDGLIYVNENDHSDIQTSKRLWCLGNFSKFIEEGAVRLACSSGTEGLRCVAFENTDGSTVIVYVNSGDKALETKIPAGDLKSYDVYTTDARHDLELTKSVENNTGGVLKAEPMSVVTVYSK